MVKWYCASPLCYNNFRTMTADGNKIKCYRIPCDISSRATYERILKSVYINWEKNGYICCEHWSTGGKLYTDHLPDIIVPKSQIQLHVTKYKKALKRVTNKKSIS